MKKTIIDELLSIKFPSTNNIFLKEKNIKSVQVDENYFFNMFTLERS